MGITDEQYRWIIDKSYWVDKNKTDCERKSNGKEKL